MEEIKENLFYRPNIAPEHSYESTSVFPVIKEEEKTEFPKTITDTFVEITKDFVELISTFKKVPESLSFQLFEINYPMLDYVMSYAIDKISSGQTGSESTSSSSELSSTDAEYEVTADEVFDEDSTTDDEDDEDFIFEISQEKFKKAVVQAEEEYEKDLVALKQEYLSKMRQTISKYFSYMAKAANSISSLDETYLLHELDGNAVQIKTETHRYLKDEIIRSQIERTNKTSLFSKTHNQENTLIVMRGLIIANLLRKRYCDCNVSDQENADILTERKTLVEARNNQSKKYDKALSNYYKYLNSMSIITNDILSMVAREAELKACLLLDGIDIYKKTDNQATSDDGSTNTQLVAKSESENTNSTMNSAADQLADQVKIG